MAHTHGTSAAAIAYAQAIIELAGDQADGLGQELMQISEIIRKDGLLRAFVADPAIRPEERWGVLGKALQGRSSALLRNAVGVLNEKNRLALLPQIALAYGQLLDIKNNQVRVEVKVAHKLDDHELGQVRERVSAALGKTAIVEQKIDDSIIGGLVLKVQGKVIDGSVKTQLDTMRRQLLSAKA